MSAGISPARFVGAALTASVATTVVGTIIAMLMGPYVGPLFGSAFLRDPKAAGLHFPSLLAGYAVIGGAIVLLREQVSPLSRVALRGLVLGLAVFLGGHLVVSGWSKMPVLPMAVSGVLDSLSVAAGACAGALILRPDQGRSHDT